MGADQSALLVCTQTGKPEMPLKLHNAKQFFQLYFDKMKEPRTGPVTEALLHIIMNGTSQFLVQDLDYKSGQENNQSSKTCSYYEIEKAEEQLNNN